MKNIGNIISLFAILLLASCSNDEYVRFDTLSKLGSEFFMGQKVAVWAGVDVSERESATYHWSCSNGHFEGPQNIFRNTWIAPREKGEYTVTCTVKCNGKSDTRTTVMVVSEYFFERFDFASTLFTATNVTATFKDGRAIVVGNKGNTQGRFYYTLTDPELVAPFTFKTDYGWKDSYKNTSTPASLLFRMNRPVVNGAEVTRYMQYMTLEMYPTAESPAQNYKMSFVEINTLTSKATSVEIKSGFAPEFKFANAEMKPITVTVGTDYMITVNVSGTDVIDSDALKLWRSNNSVSGAMNPSSFEYLIYDKCNINIDNISMFPL